jgi:hypothetical protein
MGRDLQYPDQLTDELRLNAEELVKRINSFLYELGIKVCEVSSGFRPAAINAATPGAAKKSAHMTCQACDIKDDKYQTLAKLILANPDLLVKHDLYLEDPASTIGKYQNWIHLQSRKTASGNRVFKI